MRAIERHSRVERVRRVCEQRPKAYSYLRFSTAEQSQGDSLRRQTRMAEEYASRNGLELDTQLTFKDLGVSAFHGKNARKGALGAFLEAIDKGIVPEGSLLLVESLDRMSRQDPWEAFPVFQLIINGGVTIVTLHDARTYSRAEMRENPMRLLESLIVMTRAHDESKVKSRRLKAVWEGKRARADQKPLTAIAPHWLRLNKTTGIFEVIEERAALVRRVFEMARTGLGQHRITEQLNAEHIPVFGRGAHWHRSYVAKLLSNPAVIGRMTPHTIEEGPSGSKVRHPAQAVRNYYPVIMDTALFEDVQAMHKGVNSPLRGRHASGQVNNVFGGLARCPLCNGTMTLVNKGRKGGKPYLVCAKAKAGGGCTYRSVPYSDLEAWFLERAAIVVAQAPSGDGGESIDDEISSSDAGISAIDDAIANILRGIETGGPATLAERQRLRDLEGERERLEARIRALIEESASVTGPLVKARMAQLVKAAHTADLDRQGINALLRQLCTGVIVDYNEGLLVFQWRHGGESSIVFAWPNEEHLRSQGRAI